MALHELATNAAKYGALSTAGGRVDISWQHFEENLTLVWSETGGPPVQAPSRTGFGTRIIQSSFKGSNRGSVTFDWRSEGLQCTLQLVCKVKPLLAQGERPRQVMDTAKSDSARFAPSVSRARLLLVEDEAVVGMFMEELLDEMGFAPTSPVASLGEAIAAAKRERFDGAVLDMNLKGELVYPLADLLRSQNVPFVFVTGYSELGVDSRFAGVPVVQKPVTSDALAAALFSKFGKFVAPAAAEVPASAAL
jgi:CheY-like chemotaxis protein